MAGLLIKDAYSMVKETKVFLILVVFMSLIQNDFLFAYAVFYSAMLPITALSYDERSKWNKLADMFPYSTGQIVGSKYLIGYVSVGATVLLVVCGKLLGAGTGNGMPNTEEWMALLFIVCAAILVQSINLPLMFWIGTEKGRYLFVLIVVFATLAAVTFLEDVSFSQAHIAPFALLLGALGITAAVSVISFEVSKRIYHRRK